MYISDFFILDIRNWSSENDDVSLKLIFDYFSQTWTQFNIQMQNDGSNTHQEIRDRLHITHQSGPQGRDQAICSSLSAGVGFRVQLRIVTTAWVKRGRIRHRKWIKASGSRIQRNKMRLHKKKLIGTRKSIGGMERIKVRVLKARNVPSLFNVIFKWTGQKGFQKY